MAQTRSIGKARKACKGKKGRKLSNCMKRKLKGQVSLADNVRRVAKQELQTALIGYHLFANDKQIDG